MTPADTMPDGATLRAATHADIPAIRALILDAAIALSRGFYSDAQAAALTAQVFGVDTQLIDDATYFVIVDAHDAVIASGGWSRRATLFGGDQVKPDGPDALLDPDHDTARIRAFFVSPRHARRGIGSLLMARCAADAWAAGFRRLALAATLPGVPLYRVHGFANEEPFELVLADGVRAPLVRMSRALHGPTLDRRSAFD